MIAEKTHTDLENYFESFRKNIIGYDQTFESPYGKQRILYADWTASGRLYAPIENILLKTFGPFVGNTHTETSITGTYMTNAYHEAHAIIKRHVHAAPEDVIIMHGSGMTGVVNKFQRILGLRIPEQLAPYFKIPPDEKPVVFVTHMEHHSNHTSWLETIADVECIPPDEKGAVNLRYFEDLLKKHKNRKIKIASVTACSNVTGIQTPYHEIARMVHGIGGLCFVDFACSAPYVEINMHPADPLEKLDAIYFSPHKFLGGPGTPGVLIFDSKLYAKKVPDEPGGGTVDWTNPWGGHKFLDKIELREDGGTPPFLQTIKAGLCIKLKEKMGITHMMQREEAIVELLFRELRPIANLHILADNMEHRLGVLSFYIDGLHYNLGVKLLNDRFGIQVRGGCSCAGTYGHYLLHIDQEVSHKITSKIDHGDLSEKPGWIRASIHPVMTNDDIYYLTRAIREVSQNFQAWGKDYAYDPHTNEFKHLHFQDPAQKFMMDQFDDID
jgi:selenocysteine lyase/cysteine desulfurase